MRRWLVPVTLVALVGIASPPAAASSIVYVKGGDIWRYSPNGARKRVVVRAPGISFFSAVTQDDRGRLWAVHEPARRWERFSAAGRHVGKAFNTGGTGISLHYDPVRNLPGFAGPLDPQVADDGRLLASWGVLE
jgi:sugar lactone lactonase YvrE